MSKSTLHRFTVKNGGGSYMKQIRSILAAVLAGLMCLSLAACGSSKSTGEDFRYSANNGWMTESAGSAYAPSASAPGAGIYDDSAYDKYVDSVQTPTLESPGGNSVYQQSDVKLIRRANLTIQTTEFDETVARLDALVTQFFGYYENAEIYSGSYNSKNTNRSGSYTVRIPAEQYDSFLTQVGEVGYLTRKTESTENVGEVYYDLEARLKTQRTKQERLLALLEKADTMEDIIKLESALSEVEYQIEQYSSSLKRYDGLIGYATVNIGINEVIKIVDEPTEKDPLFKRMVAGVASSFDALVEAVEDFLLWVSYNVFALVIYAVVIVFVVIVIRKKKVKHGRLWRKKSKKTVQESEQSE